MKAICLAALLMASAGLLGTQAAYAPAAAPASSAGIQPGLPQGFGQVEAELRAEIDPTTFQTNFSSVLSTKNGEQSSQLGDIKYVVGQTNSALYTLPGNGLSQGQIILEPCSLWTPHYHPRASEILYVTEGTLNMAFTEENPASVPGRDALVGGRVLNYTVPKGNSLVVPQGLIHYVFNPTCETAYIVTNFDNRDPGVVSVAQRLYGFPDNVIAAATGLTDPVALQLIRSRVDNAPLINQDGDCLAQAKCPGVAAVAQTTPTAGK